MKIKTSRDELIDLIPETEEEKMLLEILSKRKVNIASYGRNTSTGFTNLCLQFKEIDTKSTLCEHCGLHEKQHHYLAEGKITKEGLYCNMVGDKMFKSQDVQDRESVVGGKE